MKLCYFQDQICTWHKSRRSSILYRDYFSAAQVYNVLIDGQSLYQSRKFVKCAIGTKTTTAQIAFHNTTFQSGHYTPPRKLWQIFKSQLTISIPACICIVTLYTVYIYSIQYTVYNVMH